MADRTFYGPITGFYSLNLACSLLAASFGFCVYLVGSSQERPDYRDVDVRAILADADFDALFPGVGQSPPPAAIDARLLLLNLSISAYLAHHSGLPVDFQFQRMTEANQAFGGRPRNPLGVPRCTAIRAAAPVAKPEWRERIAEALQGEPTDWHSALLSLQESMGGPLPEGGPDGR